VSKYCWKKVPRMTIELANVTNIVENNFAVYDKEYTKWGGRSGTEGRKRLREIYCNVIYACSIYRKQQYIKTKPTIELLTTMHAKVSVVAS
jgi:hypothetical protein